MPQHDLVIVGASFAGLSCARAAAAKGLSVLVLEKKPSVSADIHTTGLLVKEAAEELPVPREIVRRIEGVRLYSPRMDHVDLTSPGYYFLATDTPALLEWMAERAIAAGARIECNRAFDSGKIQNGRVTLPDLGIRAKQLIGADGARSRVARTFGLGLNKRFLLGAECELARANGVDDRFLHCFLDTELAPGYLAWAIPGVHATQIGLACRRPAKPDLRALRSRLSGVFDLWTAKEVGRRGGYIPVGGPVRPFARGQVMLLGDAAGWVSPLTAGGIHMAVQLGELAGHAIADHIGSAGPEPARVVARHRPRYPFKGLMRRAIDARPPNVLYDALLEQPVFQSLAATLFYHHRGLFTPAAWRDLARALMGLRPRAHLLS